MKAKKKIKLKTRKSASRRFKLTKTGKVLHRSSRSRHLQSKKKKSTKRTHKVPKKLTGGQKKNIIKILGGKSYAS